jgi:hypothetical protein
VVGTKTPSAKFGPAEFSVAASEFRLFGVPLEKNWSPSYSCLEIVHLSLSLLQQLGQDHLQHSCRHSLRTKRCKALANRTKY